MTDPIIICASPDDVRCTCGAGESTPGGMHQDTCMHNPIARVAARAAAREAAAVEEPS
jgi:hypothetical protein